MSHRITTRARLLSGGALGVLAALAVAGTANAQTAPQDQEATEVDEIIVTGIRASIQTAVSVKRDNSSIVEVIAAEDLGKLPDQSIAESLARLPGLSVQRLDGRGQVISVRGLGPDFTSALLNGREQLTTGNNRGVEFDQYPAELLSGVVVYKTTDASLIGQSLAGTADLQTVRPLAYGRRAIAMNYRYEWNDLGQLNPDSEDSGNRYTFSYIDQFFDGTLGVALGIAGLEQPYQNQRFHSWGFGTVPDGSRVLNGAKLTAQSGFIERTGYAGVLEWRPTDRMSHTLDVFYSEFDNRQIQRAVEFPLNCCSPLSPGFTTSGGVVTAATFTNVPTVLKNDLDLTDAETLSVGLGSEFILNDRWTLTTDISIAEASRQNQIIETNSGTGYGASGLNDTVSYTASPGQAPRFTAGINYADPSIIRLTDPNGWGGSNIQAGYMNMPTVDDEMSAFRLALEGQVDFGPISSIEIGANYSSRDKSYSVQEFYLVPAGGALEVAIPTSALLGSVRIDALGADIIAYDPRAVLNSGILVRQANLSQGVLAKPWQVSEDITTLYVQADIDTQIGSIPVTGNFGVQYIGVEQSSEGFAVNNTSTTPQARSGGADYGDWLPSLNLIFELTPSDYLRVSAARTQSRPRMDQMNATFSYGWNDANRTSTDINNAYFGAGGGNPELRPWEADAFDISYEHYFGPGAYVSIAGFYKDLKTYIYNQNSVYDFTGLDYPTTGGLPPVGSFLGLYNQPTNGEGGSIQGIELAASIPFSMLHPALEGFGAVASYSDTSSEIQPNPGNPSEPIVGLSERVGNITAYYERYGFQARVSGRYRSQFLGEVAGLGASRDFRYVDDETVVDAQIGYQFQSGPLEGLSVLLTGSNLTDQEFVTLENRDPLQVRDYQVYGSTYMIGINYRF
jgi:iron complex outermembrane receptor protein